jgi:hypothetical protein
MIIFISMLLAAGGWFRRVSFAKTEDGHSCPGRKRSSEGIELEARYDLRYAGEVEFDYQSGILEEDYRPRRQV